MVIWLPTSEKYRQMSQGLRVLTDGRQKEPCYVYAKTVQSIHSPRGAILND